MSELVGGLLGELAGELFDGPVDGLSGESTDGPTSELESLRAGPKMKLAARSI